ncbi:MAG: thiamine pyrophosphate-dependent dehydrogenase E1 component subunit alpha [Burkholderiaceae bacterium]|nr:thiamine pyrophosphate-dependent dehydrogenase E1 component subunit alpha [Burkholderiaceae bacterium]
MSSLIHRELLRRMFLGRETERAIIEIDSHLHPSIGEEAVIVGTFSALDTDDVAVPHYRGALVASLARGADVRKLIAGVLGRATGPTRGRQRGDFCGAFAPNFFGMFSGTLGASIGYATGSALAAKLDGSREVTVVTFGDGTANAGVLYESLNLAAMMKLPVVFVCQNNQYAVSMPAARAIAGGDLAARAAAFGMRATDVDGNDVMQVYGSVGDAIERARDGAGPAFVHALTYRQQGHFVGDRSLYRSADEAEIWKQRDPIRKLSETVVSAGIMSDDEVRALRDEIVREVALAATAARDDPMPDPAVVIPDLNAYAR